MNKELITQFVFTHSINNQQTLYSTTPDGRFIENSNKYQTYSRSKQSTNSKSPKPNKMNSYNSTKKSNSRSPSTPNNIFYAQQPQSNQIIQDFRDAKRFQSYSQIQTDRFQMKQQLELVRQEEEIKKQQTQYKDISNRYKDLSSRTQRDKVQLNDQYQQLLIKFEPYDMITKQQNLWLQESQNQVISLQQLIKQSEKVSQKQIISLQETIKQTEYQQQDQDIILIQTLKQSEQQLQNQIKFLQQTIQQSEQESQSQINSLHSIIKQSEQESQSQIDSLQQVIKQQEENVQYLIINQIRISQNQNSNHVIQSKQQQQDCIKYLQQIQTIQLELKELKQKQSSLNNGDPGSMQNTSLIKHESNKEPYFNQFYAEQSEQKSQSQINSLQQIIKQSEQESQSQINSLQQNIKQTEQDSQCQINSLKQVIKQSEQESQSQINSLKQVIKQSEQESQSQINSLKQVIKQSEQESQGQINSLQQIKKQSEQESQSQINSLRQIIKQSEQESQSQINSLQQIIKQKEQELQSQIISLQQVKKQSEQESQSQINSLQQVIKQQEENVQNFIINQIRLSQNQISNQVIQSKQLQQDCIKYLQQIQTIQLELKELKQKQSSLNNGDPGMQYISLIKNESKKEPNFKQFYNEKQSELQSRLEIQEDQLKVTRKFLQDEQNIIIQINSEVSDIYKLITNRRASVIGVQSVEQLKTIKNAIQQYQTQQKQHQQQMNTPLIIEQITEQDKDLEKEIQASKLEIHQKEVIMKKQYLQITDQENSQKILQNKLNEAINQIAQHQEEIKTLQNELKIQHDKIQQSQSNETLIIKLENEQINKDKIDHVIQEQATNIGKYQLQIKELQEQNLQITYSVKQQEIQNQQLLDELSHVNQKYLLRSKENEELKQNDMMNSTRRVSMLNMFQQFQEKENRSLSEDLVHVEQDNFRSSILLESKEEQLRTLELEEELKSTLYEIQTLTEQNLNLKRIISHYQDSQKEELGTKFFEEKLTLQKENNKLSEDLTDLRNQNSTMQEQNKFLMKAMAYKYLMALYYKREFRKADQNSKYLQNELGIDASLVSFDSSPTISQKHLVLKQHNQFEEERRIYEDEQQRNEDQICLLNKKLEALEKMIKAMEEQQIQDGRQLNQLKEELKIKNQQLESSSPTKKKK